MGLLDDLTPEEINQAEEAANKEAKAPEYEQVTLTDEESAFAFEQAEEINFLIDAIGVAAYEKFNGGESPEDMGIALSFLFSYAFHLGIEFANKE